MRILLVGAGGVGTAFARIAARRRFAGLIVADYELARAQRAAAARDGYEAVQLDARDEQAVAALLAQRRCDALMNAADPRFVMPLFRAALKAGVHYLDMAMSLSHPDAAAPDRVTGVKLGDDQFALAQPWEQACLLALVGMGVEPGLSDDRGEPGGRAGADRLRCLVRLRRARPRGAAGAAVPRPAHRLRLAVGLRGTQRQVSARIWLSSLVVFAAGSACRHSCSMTSR